MNGKQLHETHFRVYLSSNQCTTIVIFSSFPSGNASATRLLLIQRGNIPTLPLYLLRRLLSRQLALGQNHWLGCGHKLPASTGELLGKVTLILL